MSMSLRVIVPPHPLISHWLTMLRNETTPNVLYATGLEQMGIWLTYEAIRDWMPNRKESIKTSNSTTEGIVIEYSIPIYVVPNLPGGLEIWQGARQVLPNAKLCLNGLPDEIQENSGIIFYVDQITTGKNLLKNILHLQNEGIDLKRIRVITAIASNEGLKNIGELINDLSIFCACIDPEKYKDEELSPGIGNPSMRVNTIFTEST